MNNKTILITDDSLVFRTMLEAIIKTRWPQWEILQADSASAALEILQQQKVDCVTVDYHMPGTDGLSFIKQAQQSYPDTKFVFITANLQDSLSDTLTSLGVNYIHKPITEEKVFEAMEQLG